MNHKRLFRLKFFAVVLIQLLFLLSMLGVKSYTLSSGEHIMLKTAPVDPRSLFSGDYVMLSYDVSVIMLNQVETDIDYNKLREDYTSGRYNAGKRALNKVYVKLAKKSGEQFWSVVSATLKKPSVNSGEVLLVSKEGDYMGWDEKAQIRLKYGIESYYVTEGGGLEIEKTIRNRNASAYVEVAVDRFGNAGIVAIYQDGKRIE